MNPAVKERVDAFIVDLYRAPVARHVLGVVVSGSAARGEEIWNGDRLVSDIDLMVLTRRTDPRLIAAVGAVVDRHRHTGVDGGAVPVGPLRRHLTFSFYEARATGVVMAGSVDLDRLVPPIAAADLPPWEGVRVLGNRLLEHVKHSVGAITAERVVAKSYEALAEAHLAVEKRYRPSYSERLAEIERAGPAAAGREVAEAMCAVLRQRLGHAGPPPVDVAVARGHLVDGLGQLIAHCTGVRDGPAAGLARLARRETHWKHRLYWAARLATQRRFREIDLRVDPVLRVWRLALDGPASTVDADRLLRDWRACPQILVSRKV
ncbi:hypothetical protein GCM10009557_66200 [Virgisporangium ochraceum]